MTATLLLLAGTAEARDFAGRFGRTDLRLIASLAGVTRDPLAYPCETRIGGFGGAEAMARWMVTEQVVAVIDATHPFARRISDNAVMAARAAGIPHLMLRRPPWTQAGRGFGNMPELAQALPAGARVLLTTGRAEIDPFAARSDVSFLLRSIEPVDGLPAHIEPLLLRPPFSVDGELALLRQRRITHLVTKNSGGARPAKLDAADRLGVEVFSLSMPPTPGSIETVETVGAALDWAARL